MPTVPEIEPKELKTALENGSVFLLDVREPEEHQRVMIAGSVLIPLMELEGRIDELRQLVSQSPRTVVYCRIGGRSEMAIRWLQGQGISNLENLRGGINAYAKEADTSLEAY